MIALEETLVYVIGGKVRADLLTAVADLLDAGALVAHPWDDSPADHDTDPWEWYAAEVGAMLSADVVVSVPSALDDPESRSLLQVALAGHPRMMTLSELTDLAA